MIDDAGNPVRPCRPGDLTDRASREARRGAGWVQRGTFRYFLWIPIRAAIIFPIITGILWLVSRPTTYVPEIIWTGVLLSLTIVFFFSIGRAFSQRTFRTLGKRMLLKDKVCPGCGYDLSQIEQNEHMMVRCAECGGVWQLREELADVLARATRSRDARRANLNEPSRE